MLKVNFYIKTDKAKTSGECPIYVQVKLFHQRATIATGKFIENERWKKTDQLRSLLKIDKEKVLKHSLDLFKLEIEKKYNWLAQNEPGFDIERLKQEVLGKTPQHKSVTVKTVFDTHNQFFLKKVQAGERADASYQKYERAKGLLLQFVKNYYNTADFEVQKINSAFIVNLESFLRYESDYNGKIGIKNNSVVKYFKMFKTAFNYAIRLDLILKNPFDMFIGKLSINETVFLTSEELRRIANKDFKVSRLNKVKDVFLFSCYTGYPPVDSMKLTESNLLRDSSGDLWLKANRTKTHIKENVPVLPPVKSILEKYRGSDKLLPSISNQKMNAYLKEIADVCDIDKNLTWYVARHTFATTVTLGNGVRIENVSAMLGHTNIRQTQHYAKILDHNVMSDMKMLFDKFS
jgi:site-specific recombinase XerD